MLDGLNDEIKKIKDLFSNNINSNSFCNKNSEYNNHITNQSIEMSAGEDFIDNEECRSIKENTFVEQAIHKNSADHDLYPKNIFNKNQSFLKGVFHDNEDDTNTSQNSYTHQNVYQQEKDDEFYQIQSSDIKTDNLNIEHFFSWHNPYACQCGMICNKN
uniref:Uncharacterized protein n=1 Tax=Schizaphis graminum TaxID=13262 RepID=A0A2S2NT54_SCHGA